MKALRHWWRFGHLPDVVEYENFLVCIRCSRGRPLRTLRMTHAAQPW